MVAAKVADTYGTGIVAHKADWFMPNAAACGMLGAKDVSARLELSCIICTEGLLTVETILSARCATRLFARVASLNSGGRRHAGWAQLDTVNTICLTVRAIDVIIARTHDSLALNAHSQTVLTEPLSACFADRKLGTELLTAGTAHGTGIANENLLFVFCMHAVGPQVRNALALSTMGTFVLASVADSIETNRTLTGVLMASPLTARPTDETTYLAVFTFAYAAARYGARRTKKFKTTRTLMKARIAS